VEECLCKHDAVKEVVSFGVPRSKFEYNVCAWVKLESDKSTVTVEDLREYCSNHLETYKVPKYIKFVNEFPVSKMNKYLRTQMEKEYATELNLL
jgi:acyl-CoA synthetase (AMP-forming)/AMP-acid ligase II